MVLESILKPKDIENHPIMIFFIGFVYASIGIFIGIAKFYHDCVYRPEGRFSSNGFYMSVDNITRRLGSCT